MDGIILFDGECSFCKKSIQFIIKRDLNDYFKFASLQSDVGKELRNNFNIPNDLDSLILIEKGKTYSKSSAVLRICKNLKGIYKLAVVFFIFPKFFRDFFYDRIANNRYKLVSKKNTCVLPSSDIREKFLD